MKNATLFAIAAITSLTVNANAAEAYGDYRSCSGAINYLTKASNNLALLKQELKNPELNEAVLNRVNALITTQTVDRDHWIATVNLRCSEKGND